MNTGKSLLAAAIAAFLAAPAARAESVESRWSVRLQGGIDVGLSGNLHEGGQGTVLSLPTSVQAKRYDDIYNTSFRGQAALGYWVTPRGEVFLRGSYYKAQADTLQVGTVAGLRLNGDFSEYKEWGVEAGYRFLLSEAELKPYIAPVVGLRFTSELPATFSVPAAGVVLTDVPFYDSSTVGVFGADLGISYEATPQLVLGLEAGLRYRTGLSQLEGLAGTGLEGINDTGARWSLPIVGTIGFRF